MTIGQFTRRENEVAAFYMATCRRCKSVQRIEGSKRRIMRRDLFGNEVVARIDERAPEVECCGQRPEFNRILGTRGTHECDARCVHATGHVCECSCGGKNHGAGWSA